MSHSPHRAAASMLEGHAPLLHSAWDSRRLNLVSLLAILPPLAAAVYLRGAEYCWVAGLAVAVALGWQALFALVRRTVPGWEGLISGLAFALLVPEQTALWQQALALSFGVVMGEQVFGGRGWSFVNPVVVALAFLLFSFPALEPRPSGVWLAAASLPGGLLLLVSGLSSWRVLAGIIVGLVAFELMLESTSQWQELITGTMVFGMVFLACDPFAAAASNSGRWIYGFLTGALAIVFGLGSGEPGSVYQLAFALLVGSVFAPLIDRAVVALNIRRRRMRHG